MMRGAVNHIDLTVTDVEAAAPVYQTLLGFLGYSCVKDTPTKKEWDLLTKHGFCSVGIKNAERRTKHDRYAPGLHHLAWTASSRDDVDRLYEALRSNRVEILDPPADYPEYGPGYYAVFFTDPDGLKLEFVYWPKGEDDDA